MILHPSAKRMTSYLDGVLPEVQACRFEAHLAKCEVCRRKLQILRSASRVFGLPKRRLDAISESVMERVGQIGNLAAWNVRQAGQADSLSYERRQWNTDAPILGEIQSVDGTVFVRSGAGDKAIEAFPGCALRQGDRLEPAAEASAVVQLTNGATLHITKAADLSSLAEAMAAISSGASGRTLPPSGRRLQMRFTWASGTVAVAMAIVLAAIVVPKCFDAWERTRIARARRDVQRLALAEERAASRNAGYVPLQVLDDPARAASLTYDPTNGTVSGGDVWRVKQGDEPRLAPVISCIPDIIVSDADGDPDFFIFNNALDLDELVSDNTAASSLLKWSLVQSTPGKPSPASQGSAGQNQQAPPAPSKSPAPKTTPTSSTTEKRLVIYTAAFSILVSSVEDSMKDLLQKIEKWNGYVQTADLQRVTFRVPAANFNRVVEEISQLGVVTNKQVQAHDVTRQYVDLQLRMEVAEMSRKRLLALLEKAQKTEDLLKIENEIRRLTEEIEKMKGEIRLLADQIAYSTIAVDLTAKAAEAKPARPRAGVSYFPWINQIGAENVIRYF